MPARPVKKSAAKPLAKKVTAAKRRKPKEDSPGDVIAQAIISGDLDGWLGLIDDALEQRSRAVNEVERAASATAKTEKKVSAPPKRTATKAEITFTKGETYAVSDKVKSLAGAKVKFHNFKADSMKKKSVVEMLVDKPGNPKGKKVILPTIALVEYKARGRAKK